MRAGSRSDHCARSTFSVPAGERARVEGGAAVARRRQRYSPEHWPRPEGASANDVGIEGLAPFALFQHQQYAFAEAVAGPSGSARTARPRRRSPTSSAAPWTPRRCSPTTTSSTATSSPTPGSASAWSPTTTQPHAQHQRSTTRCLKRWTGPPTARPPARTLDQTIALGGLRRRRRVQPDQPVRQDRWSVSAGRGSCWRERHPLRRPDQTTSIVEPGNTAPPKTEAPGVPAAA